MAPTNAEDAEEADDAPEDDAQSLKNYARRPRHQQCLAEIFQLDSDELLTRLDIKKYGQDGYIPAEVLVTLARGRYGSTARVRNAIALCLNERLVIELRHFLNKNLQWYGVMTRDSESAEEAMADVRLKIFKSQVEVSFAEVSFRTFVDKRLIDWFKSQIRFKNAMPSVDGIKPAEDEDGGQLSLTEQVVDDVGLTPEEKLAQKELFAECRLAVQQLPDKQRTALILYVLQDMTCKQAGEVMRLEESSVRKYVKSALEALRNGDWHD